jgi:hypothetical protein
LQTLQHAEKREGDADLEENKNGPSGRSPDTKPD